jgi:hypothetical protein
MLLETKSLLAKLMATENLQIEQRKVETAMFNTKTRVLTVPILDKNVPAYTYDLFMGHEVGHALYTPFEGWASALTENLNKAILNVVEDSRIERKIKYKYPGIRNSFVKAYNDLHEQNFFETKDKNLNALNFIDRINLHQKVGPVLNITFNDVERDLLKEVEGTESFEDVVEVTKKIQKHMEDEIREQMQQKKQKVKVKVVKGGDNNEEGKNELPEDIDPDADTEFDIEFEEGALDGKGDESGEKKEPDESDSKNSNGTGERESEETEKESEKSESSNQPKSKFEQDLENAILKAIEKEIRSFTDEAYKDNEKTLFDSSAGSFTYVNIPKFDSERCIFDYKDLYHKYKTTYVHTDAAEYSRIRNESNKVVSYLVKEFELRKNADQSKRATIAKTGELNMNKLFSYKFNEDIFKKITVMPGGKSHGLVMFLDWSGSMHNHLENTIKQLISLVLFCKKVSIPFEVYAFVDSSVPEHTAHQVTTNEGEMILGTLSLLNVLSSRMSASDFTYACSALVYMSANYQPAWMKLGSTPLNESIIAAMDIIPKFQKKYGLQIVNTVFLTDGDSNCQRSVYTRDRGYQSTQYISCRKGDVVTFRDNVTKNEVKVTMSGQGYSTEFTSCLIQLLKVRTKCNIVGFYVISGREFANMAPRWYRKNDVEEIKTNFKKDNYAILTDSGFDEYYFLRSTGLNTDEEEFDVEEGVSRRGLVSAFTKYAGNKISNRIILNRFIGMIA